MQWMVGLTTIGAMVFFLGLVHRRPIPQRPQEPKEPSTPALQSSNANG